MYGVHESGQGIDNIPTSLLIHGRKIHLCPDLGQLQTFVKDRKMGNFIPDQVKTFNDDPHELSPSVLPAPSGFDPRYRSSPSGSESEHGKGRRAFSEWAWPRGLRDLGHPA